MCLVWLRISLLITSRAQLMIFLLRKPWTRNWVRCVSLPAEVAKPCDTQLCSRCFRGWGALCAAEELTAGLGGFPPWLQEGTEPSWPKPGSEHLSSACPGFACCPFPLWPGVLQVGFPELPPLQRFPVLGSSARASHASLLGSLCYYLFK